MIGNERKRGIRIGEERRRRIVGREGRGGKEGREEDQKNRKSIV